MHHDSVAAEIDPAFVEIAADRDIEGAQITPAVAFMPMWRRQGQKIDVLAFEYVFQHRSRGDFARRDQLRPVQALLPGIDELIARVVERQMIGQALALQGRVVNAGEHAPARRIVFDLVEQHRGRRLGLRRDLGHRADLLIPIGAFDDTQLAE